MIVRVEFDLVADRCQEIDAFALELRCLIDELETKGLLRRQRDIQPVNYNIISEDQMIRVKEGPSLESFCDGLEDEIG